MRLKLKKLRNPFVQGPLFDHGLFPGNPWKIGEIRDIPEDETAIQILAKYGEYFERVYKGDDIDGLVRMKKKYRKNKLAKPGGVK